MSSESGVGVTKRDGSVTPGDEPESRVVIQQVDDEEGEGQEALPEAPERDKWGSKVAYFLTLVGYAVGFGNIWRFPYQMRENGGLVFLIPYSIMLALLGIPLFFLELAVGQRRRKGVVYAWAEISPALGGVGLACGWLCFMVGLYYNTLIAYCLSYLIDSFRNPLPWTSCKTVSESHALQRECQDKLHGRSTKYYWYRQTLDISEGYEYPGNYNWWLFMYLGVAWIAIYGILLKGTKSVGMVVYFTAVFPYVVLLAFFIANLVIEPGKGWLGAYRLLKPDWSVLLSPVTWLKAGSQIFFSLGLAEGCLVVFASYNPARNNCYKDAINISLINCCTSMFAALVVFPVIGRLGHERYEECFHTAAKYFPNSTLSNATLEKKYDIYFFGHEGKKWEWMEEDPSNAITIRYGYGELGSADAKKDWKNHFEQLEHDTITWSGVAASMVDGKKDQMISNFFHDCSIGMEATASGGGTGFVFMGFTEAVKHLPLSNFWSVLFFIMLLTLGIDSGFGTVEGVIAAVEDVTQWKRWVATTVVCGFMTFLAICIFPFGSGIYVLDLLDQYTANWTFLCIALLECIAVAWIYGLAKFSYDVRLMTGTKPNMYILLCWKYISPVFIVIMLIGSVSQFIMDAVAKGGLKYRTFFPQHPKATEGDLEQDFPPHVLFMGFFLMFFCIIWVPVQFYLRRTRCTLLKDQAPAAFPEEELREERSIHVSREEDQFTTVEKAIMGRESLMNLQQHRDETVRKTSSQIALEKEPE